MSVILEVWDSMVVKIIAAIVGPILLAAFYYIFRRIYRAFKALKFAESALKAVARETADNGLPNEGPGFWLKQPVGRPSNYGDLQGSNIPDFDDRCH